MVRFLDAAIWLVPAAVLMRSGWDVLGMGVCVIPITKILSDFRRNAKSSALLSSVTIAALLQAGAVAKAGGERELALFLLILGLSWFAWNLSGGGRPISSAWLPIKLALPALATVLLALLLGSARVASHSGTGLEEKAANVKGPNLHDGIILRPEHLRNVTILVPPPLSRERRGAQAIETRPFHIPFSGEYWFFHAFFHRVGTRLVAFHERPPETSMVEAGDPTEWNFTGPAMTMKAHQKLDTLIDLACCRGIDIAFTDADASPGTYTAELLLSNSKSSDPAAQSQSLGVVSPVQAAGGEETAAFPLPAHLPLARFDTLDVVFHMAVQRRNRSVNVAIREFQLIPAER